MNPSIIATKATENQKEQTKKICSLIFEVFKNNQVNQEMAMNGILSACLHLAYDMRLSKSELDILLDGFKTAYKDTFIPQLSKCYE